MRISWNWLKQYIDTDLGPQEAADILTSTGLEVEGVEAFEPIRGMLAGVVVGHVLGSGKHPDADRLSVTMVDLGGHEAQIVCGAPNVAAGQKVLVATVGTTLYMHDGTSLVIKKSKIRGVESHGMICAEDELGLGQGHDGILVLDPDAPVGLPAADFLKLTSDHVLEIGLTPNRTDAMGHVGVARDLIAALNHRRGLNLELKLPDVSAYTQDHEGDAVNVEVQAPVAAPRYAGVTLTDVQVGPSPQWLQDRLLAIGLKPINNVVDVTNYVQHELAQPLHAFDADRLSGRRIVVRMAKADEPFTTLDEKERKLDAGDLVIADAENPACIAGVFGGLRSGVTETTTTVFLESACFDPAHIRRTARRHGLNTDASFRFERGVDPELTVYALKRAALMLKEVAGARIASTITDIDNEPHVAREVRLGFAEVERLAGVHIDGDDIVRILELLDFRIRERNGQGLHVVVPANRTDVYRPADVIEEVLRIHGYDEVPIPAHLKVPAVTHAEVTLEGVQERIAMHLAARGFREVMTPSLVNGALAARLGAAEETALVRLQNPLSAELDVLRPVMLFGGLQALAHNINRQQRDLRFFERGRTYATRKGGTEENEHTALWMTGRRWPEGWRNATAQADLAELRGEAEVLLKRLAVGAVLRDQAVEHPLLEEATELHLEGRRVAVLGRVPAHVLKAFDIAQPVYHAVLEDEALRAKLANAQPLYDEVPRFPSVRRDLSLLLDASVRFDTLRQVAFATERKLLKEVGLFDVYQGDKLPSGKKSYALSFILQDTTKTLTDQQVDKAMGRIRQALEKEVGAELRG